MWSKSSFTTSAVAAISFCLIGGTSPAAADILHVPGDFLTIQEAIDAAMDGDEVEVHPGTYNEAIDFLGKAIIVRSSDGPDVTIIDAQQTGTVVTCDSAEGPDSVLEGFTITGGDGASKRGGGMRNVGSSPTVINCTFNENNAQFEGGGMYNTNFSNATLRACTFTGNTAGRNGGGMYNINSSPTLTDCTFVGNTSSGNNGHGGGMYNDSSSPLLANCTFDSNTVAYSGGPGEASGAGGGMYSIRSELTVTNCNFTQNHAFGNGNSLGAKGGGMYNASSTLALTSCTFTGNTAYVLVSFTYGGGIYTVDSSLTITNCTFSGNKSLGGIGGIGGAIYQSYGNGGRLTTTNCTFSNNSANSWGGAMVVGDNTTITNCTFSGNASFGAEGSTAVAAISVSGSNVVVTNSTIVGNVALGPNGSAVRIYGSGNTVTNCILWDNSSSVQISGPATVSYSDVEGGWSGAGSNNLDADPLFVEPGYWDDNGPPDSPYDDFWFDGDFRLSPGSPCIDAGNNWGVPIDENDYDEDGVSCELFPVDLDGNPRFNADEADFDPGCGVPVVVDMGAYEYQFDPVDQVTFADLNGDDAVGVADLLGLLGSWGPCVKGCCLADLDIDGNVGASDLDTLLANWGQCP